MALGKATNTKAAPPQPTRVSFNPDTQTTGFLDDVDVEITDAQTTNAFDYGGHADPVPALCLELTDVNGGTHVQYWSAGKTEDWAATGDNSGFTSPSGKNGFSSQSNVAMLFKSLVEVGGEPMISILDSGDCKQLIGLKGHIMIKTLPKRGGLVRTGKNADKDPTVLVFSKIDSLPGTDTTKKAATGKAAPASTKAANGKANGAAATTASTETDDMDSQLIAALLERLGEEDPLPKKTFTQIASAAFKGQGKIHSAAIARANNPAFLKSLGDSGIAFDGAQFSLGTE